MPAQSQQQQKLFGLALAFKRGEVPSSEVSDEIKAIADRMSEKEIEDFASTNHKGLPKKMKEQLRNIVREIMREQAISEMDEVSINEDENPCWDGYEMVGMKMKDGKEVPNCVPKNESVNEEVINEIGVLGVAGGVALGLVGFIALSKGVGFAKRKFGDAMSVVADKMEKKVKKIESDNAKKAIMDIAKKFENDKKLQGMYQSLPAYKDGGKNSERKKGMAEIAKYVKSKLSSDEMEYFYDLNTYLRTNKIKGTLVAPEKKSAFQKRLDKLGADNAHLGNESVNEAASKEAMGIAALTGTRGSAVEEFINKHDLDGGKLFRSIKKANLQGRLNFVSALAGKDGNPNQKLTIKLHKKNESVNEGASTEEKRIVMMAIKKIAKYRNVPLNVAVVDTIRAAEELERTIKK